MYGKTGWIIALGWKKYNPVGSVCDSQIPMVPPHGLYASDAYTVGVLPLYDSRMIVRHTPGGCLKIKIGNTFFR